MGIDRNLGWYRHLVHNRSVPGSLFTLLHLPFMLSFLSLVLLGTFSLGRVDDVVLLLSLAAVAAMLYGEHMLDDTTDVGKPWDGQGPDIDRHGRRHVHHCDIDRHVCQLPFRDLASIGRHRSGIGFCTLYGLEIWNFHRVWFGALGMGVSPCFPIWPRLPSPGRCWTLRSRLCSWV